MCVGGLHTKSRNIYLRLEIQTVLSTAIVFMASFVTLPLILSIFGRGFDFPDQRFSCVLFLSAYHTMQERFGTTSSKLQQSNSKSPLEKRPIDRLETSETTYQRSVTFQKSENFMFNTLLSTLIALFHLNILYFTQYNCIFT